MIHADLTSDNVLVNGDRARLIDFDDAGFGWHLFEIATSLYFYSGQSSYGKIRDSLIEGYRTVRALRDEELEHLPLFLLARGTTYLGWAHTRDRFELSAEHVHRFVDLACTHAEDYLSCH